MTGNPTSVSTAMQFLEAAVGALDRGGHQLAAARICLAMDDLRETSAALAPPDRVVLPFRKRATLDRPAEVHILGAGSPIAFSSLFRAANP